MKWSKIDCNYIRFDSKTKSLYANKITEKEMCDVARTLDMRIGVFNNVYVTVKQSIGDENGLYVFNKDPEIDKLFIPKNNEGADGACVGRYEEVISFGNSANFIFGHWFIDTLTPLMLLPEDILLRAMICVHSSRNFIFETLHALGVSNTSIVVLKDNDYCIARVAYVTIPYPYINHFGLPMKILSMRLKKSFGVDRTEPTEYVFMNRNSIARRIYASTMNTLYSYFKNNYDEYHWSFYDDNPNTVKGMAVLWSTIKFLFAPTGSNLVGIIFMNKDSVVVDAQSDMNDKSFQGMALSLNVFVLSFCSPGSRHLGTGFTVEIEKAKKMIKVGLFVAKFKKWPDRSPEYDY